MERKTTILCGWLQKSEFVQGLDLRMALIKFLGHIKVSLFLCNKKFNMTASVSYDFYVLFNSLGI